MNRDKQNNKKERIGNLLGRLLYKLVEETELKEREYEHKPKDPMTTYQPESHTYQMNNMMGGSKYER